MITVRRRSGRAWTIALAAAITVGGVSAPSFAQESPDVRIRRLEAEVRALQRKVFPGGAGSQTFTPEISAPTTVTPAPGAPATTPLSDLLARVDALEAQIARITAQGEQNSNRIAQIEARLPPATPPSTVGPPADSTTASTPPPSGTAPATPPANPPSTGASGTGASRLDAVRAVARPQTADAADDAYSYGYRLWEAKFYPEAEQQLRLYLQKYPSHSRVSYARNLIGRAYLADGDPREAAKWFLQNYQADKAGARAPDSLLYLGRSMKQIGDGKRACVALGEFASSYAAEAAGRLKADYDDARKGLSCGA